MKNLLDLYIKSSELAGVGIWEYDIVNKKLKWDNVVKSIHEVPEDFQPSLINAIEFYKNDFYKSKILTNINTIINNGGYYNEEYEILTYNNNLKYVKSYGISEFDSGVCVRLYGTFQDITKSKKITLELEKERQRLSAIIDSAKLGTWEWHVQSDDSFFNERWAEILGHKLSDLLPISSQKWRGFIEPNDYIGLDKVLNACLNKQADFFDHQYRMKHKDGTWVWIHSRGKVVKWDGDIPIVMVGTVLDICDRKNQEQLLKDNFDIITDQNKKLLNFAYIVSHNLRSHAGNFQVLLDLYVSEYDTSEKEEIMRLLNKNAENLQETVDNLNEVVQIQTNINKQIVPLNLYKQIKKLVDGNLKSLRNDNINVIINVPEDLELKYNPAYLESILLNFLTNAIKYRYPNRNAEIEYATSYENDKLVLRIKDNGIGIDLKRNGDKVFGMYKTFHNNKDAKGIGLFITKNQIEAMGGTVSVESELGVGTVFKVVF